MPGPKIVSRLVPKSAIFSVSLWSLLVRSQNSIRMLFCSFLGLWEPSWSISRVKKCRQSYATITFLKIVFCAPWKSNWPFSAPLGASWASPGAKMNSKNGSKSNPKTCSESCPKLDPILNGSWTHFGIPSGGQNGAMGGTLCSVFSGTLFWHHLGPILVPFWPHFGPILALFGLSWRLLGTILASIGAISAPLASFRPPLPQVS